jgi:hypothetical protein
MLPVALAFRPAPDLSYHVEIEDPLDPGLPLLNGSDASSHNTHPGTDVIEKLEVIDEYVDPLSVEY